MYGIFQCRVIFGLGTVFLGDDNVRHGAAPRFLRLGDHRRVTSVESDHQLPAGLFSQFADHGAVTKGGGHRLFAESMYAVVHEEGDLLGVDGLGGQHESAVQTQVHKFFNCLYRVLRAEGFGGADGVLIILCHHAHKFDVLGLCQHGQIVVFGDITGADDTYAKLISH